MELVAESKARFGALPGTRVLGPLGTVAGALYGAKKGAEAGGALAGKAAESVYEAFKGDFDVIAHLDQGSIEASIGLHYTPFIRLSLGATGFQWVANISAELLTEMDLIAKAALSLAGSNVTLHFRDGSLVRTVFTLTPTATLGLALTAEGRVKLKGSFLNILEETAGPDKALISGEYITGQFPLFEVEGLVGATTEFQFAKGSPMDVLSKKVKAAKDGTRATLIKGLRKSVLKLPFLKQPTVLNERSRTGLTDKEAILMDWHKPADWYPDYLYRPSKSARGRGEQIAKFPHLTYDNGFSAGVAYWPYEGKTLQYRGGEEPRGNGVKKFMRELEEEGIELDRDLAYKADIDHVIDWAFNGQTTKRTYGRSIAKPIEVPEPPRTGSRRSGGQTLKGRNPGEPRSRKSRTSAGSRSRPSRVQEARRDDLAPARVSMHACPKATLSGTPPQWGWRGPWVVRETIRKSYVTVED